MQIKIGNKTDPYPPSTPQAFSLLAKVVVCLISIFYRAERMAGIDHGLLPGTQGCFLMGYTA